MRKKLKGSSLFYAIVLSLLIGIVLLSISTLNYYKSMEFEIHQTSSQLISNCRSAEAILFSEYTNKSKDAWHQVYEIDQPTYFSYNPWGLYFVGKSKSVIRKDTLKSAFLFGERWHNDGVAIHLKNGISGLNISGRTQLVGNAAVPGGRIKPAFIENQSFQGGQLITGTVSEPKRPFPKVANGLIQSLKSLNPLALRGKSTQVFNEISDSLNIDFSDDTEVLYSADSISLNGFQLYNNIIVCSGKAVQVGAFCNAENIIISAPRIYISEGFSGALQCYSQSKLIVESNVLLNYPSSLVLSGEDADEIEISTGAILEGNVLVVSESEEATLTIGSDAKITGVICSTVSTQLKGSVHGTVIVDELYLKTGSGYYKNYLLNAEVNATTLPSWFCGTPLQGKKGKPIRL